MIEQLTVRYLRRRIPLRTDRLRGPICCDHIPDGHAHKVSVTNHPYSRNLLRLRRVARGQLRMECGWTDNLAVKHTGQAEIGSVLMRARDKIAAIPLWCRSAGDL